MGARKAVLYLADLADGEDALLQSLAAKYRVLKSSLIQRAAGLAVMQEIGAAVLCGGPTIAVSEIAEKLKLLNPRLPVLLVCTDAGTSVPSLPHVDAIIYCGSPREAVSAITSYLESSEVHQLPISA